MLAGNAPAVSIILGACLALSSTAIVVEVLSNQGRLATTAGRASFSVLLAQDLAVIPILLFVSILGAGASSSVMTSLVLALANAALAVGGDRCRRPAVAATAFPSGRVHRHQRAVRGGGVVRDHRYRGVAAMAGLSMALGAFVAGLLLAETEFRKAIETTIGPFKGLLLGLFFFTVGMNIDVRELARQPLWLFASVVGLIGIKSILLTGLARIFRLPWSAAIETGCCSAPAASSPSSASAWRRRSG